MESIRDKHTILSNTDGIVIATQKEWHRLSEDELAALTGYEIINVKVSTGSVYFILRNMNAFEWLEHQDKMLLMKSTTNQDTGRVEFFSIELNKNEAMLVKVTPVSLWE